MGQQEAAVARVAPSDSLFAALMGDQGDLMGRWTAYEPRFREFARVLSDEGTALRLDVADVACMLDVSCDDLVRIANGEAVRRRSPGPPALEETRPAWADRAATVEHSVDAAAILGRGHEPLRTILEAVGRMQDGEMLMVRAPFHPKPLRRLLRGRGYESFAEQVAPDQWRAYFRRPPASAEREEGRP
jgi:uncharacterized protein (DUF2249 family)